MSDRHQNDCTYESRSQAPPTDQTCAAAGVAGARAQEVERNILAQTVVLTDDQMRFGFSYVCVQESATRDFAPVVRSLSGR